MGNPAFSRQKGIISHPLLAPVMSRYGRTRWSVISEGQGKVTYRSYRGYGLRIRSCVPIAGAVEDEGDGVAPEIEIDFGAARLSACEATVGGFSRGPEGLLFASPVGSFLMTSDRIIIEPTREADVDAIAIRLTATVLPALISVRSDDIVLHACALVKPGSNGCVAICGPSGAGKSTIARIAMARGAKLVADDTVRLERKHSRLLASGLPMQIFRSKADGRREGIPIVRANIVEKAPLQRIVILGKPGTASAQTRFEPIAADATLREVVAQLHRSNAAVAMGRQAAILPTLAAASRIELIGWNRKMGDEDLSDEEWSKLFGGNE